MILITVITAVAQNYRLVSAVSDLVIWRLREVPQNPLLVVNIIFFNLVLLVAMLTLLYEHPELFQLQWRLHLLQSLNLGHIVAVI